MRLPWQRKITIGGSGHSGYLGSQFIVGGRESWQSLAAGFGGSVFENSAVMACAAWFMDTLGEAKPCVVDKDGEPVENHVLNRLFERPNPVQTWSQFIGATGVDLMDGNAYWQITKDRNAQPQARFLPASSVMPEIRGDAVVYVVQNALGRTETILSDEIIHFKTGMDPQNPLKGMSRLASVMREIRTDCEATVYNHAILKNMGVMGWLITPASAEDGIDAEMAKELKEKIHSQMTGEDRGKPAVLNIPAKVEAIGHSPDKLHVREVIRTAEERICAVFRIPPMVVGLGAGLERSTFSNMEQAREMAVESGNCPIWAAMGDTLTHAYSPFGATRLLKHGERVHFDTSTVRALQEDEDERHTRARENFADGIWSLAESRQYTGKEVLPGQETVYATNLAKDRSEDALLAQEAEKSRERARLMEALK